MLGERQTERLSALRSSRNNEAVATALAAIKHAAATSENLFPLVLDAVRQRATLGEIMNALKDEFGTYMAPSGF
jgi:methylmalonyl-CoA mutase N-terminal domain/subunit